MLIVHLLAGITTGLAAAIATFWAGSGLLLAFAAYSLGGALGLTASAMLMTLRPRHST